MPFDAGGAHGESADRESDHGEPGVGDAARPGRRFANAEQRADAVIADIGAQAAAWDALDDALAADELARAEIARIGLLDRLRAVTGEPVELQLPDRALTGRVSSVWADGVAIHDGVWEWVVRAEAITSALGLGPRTRAPSRVDQRLSVASTLREWAVEGAEVLCVGVEGSREGVIARVGRDHLDLLEQDFDRHLESRRSARGARTIPFHSLWAVRSRC